MRVTIRRGIRLQNGINTGQMSLSVSLTLKMKPLGKFSLNNLEGQEYQAIQKGKLWLIYEQIIKSVCHDKNKY